ncbi:unnamed protein product [Adineta ricciae]|uniref:Uncharacterized protein n=1 Tax=Adineta ricciae TaxID=249248 RepID=A0A815L9V4_ADIRI|nr:unnamed protein product [Adineta ricciae]
MSVTCDTCNRKQFKLLLYLNANTAYVLVVLTYQQYATGAFLFIVNDPKKVEFKTINKSSIIYSVYSSTLNASSQTYTRCFLVPTVYYETFK